MAKEKYIIPEEGERWVLKAMRDHWKVYKCRIKGKHFDDYDTKGWRIGPKEFLLLILWNFLSIGEARKQRKFLLETEQIEERLLTRTPLGHEVMPKSKGNFNWQNQMGKNLLKLKCLSQPTSEIKERSTRITLML